MEEAYSRKEKLAGVFLFLVLLLSLVALLVIGQGKAWFKAQRTYLVKFPQGYNLVQGAAVKMFNAEVGKVTKIHISRVRDENQVEFTIQVLAEYADLIRQDSVAEVQSPTLLGSEYISISPGSSGYPPIAAHGTIPSRVRKTLTDYLEELQPEETLRRVRQIMQNLAHLSEQLRNHEQQFLAMANNFNDVMKSILEAKGSLGQLLVKKDFYNRLEGALFSLEKVLQNSRTITDDLRAASIQLPGLTTTVGQEVDRVKAILTDLQAGMQEFPGLMESAGDAARSGREVLDAVKANPLIKLTAPKTPASRSIHLEPRDVP